MQEDAEAADLDDVLDVGLCKLSRSQQVGLLAAPGKEIAVVERALH
jgi:hypothetical protein